MSTRIEDFIAEMKRGGVKDPVKQRELIAIATERLAVQRGERIKAGVAAERKAQASGGGRDLAGGFGAAALHAVNSAALGYAPAIAGGIDNLTGGNSRENLEDALDISSETNPIASTVGDIGGLFAGAAGKVAQVGSRGLTALTGRQAKVAATLGDSFIKRGIAQSMNNLVGGAGALTATRLLEHREEDYSLGARLYDSVEDSMSPLAVGLAVATGGISAKFTRSMDRDLKDIISKFERTTGEKVPLDVLTNNRKLQNFMDAAARNPSLVTRVEKVRARMTKGLELNIREMRMNNNPRGASRSDAENSAAAARAARKIQGSLGNPGAATVARRAPQKAALAVEGHNIVDHATKDVLVRGLTSILNDNATKGKEAIGGFSRIVKETKRLVTGDPILNAAGKVTGFTETNVYQLEKVRKMAGKLGWAGPNKLNPLDPRNSDKARKMARDFYHVISDALDGPAPTFARAVKSGEKFRRMEESLNPEKIQSLDDEVMAAFWGEKGLLGKNGRLFQSRRFNSIEDQQAAAGWLLGKLLQKVVDPHTSMVNPKLLRAETSRSGMFNREVISRVLPGVEIELMELGALSNRMKQGIMKAAGSDTATRGTILAKQKTMGAALVGGVVALLHNPFGGIATALGVAGVQTLFDVTRRSLIQGTLGNKLDQLARRGPNALSRSSVAALGISDKVSQLQQ